MTIPLKKSKCKKRAVIGKEKKNSKFFNNSNNYERKKEICLALNLVPSLMDVVLDQEHDLKISDLSHITVNNIKDQFFFFDVSVIKDLCEDGAYKFLEKISKSEKMQQMNCKKCGTKIPSNPGDY